MTILQGLVRQSVQGRNYDISAGQHQPSSGLFTSPCSIVLYFIIIFDWSRSTLIQRGARLIVHGSCSGFQNLKKLCEYINCAFSFVFKFFKL